MAAKYWPVVVPRAVPASASNVSAASGLLLAMAGSSLQPFPKSARLRAAPEFQAVFKTGLKCSGVFFRLYFRSSATATARLGLAVPKKAVPLSVVRNRLKRLCREFFRSQSKAAGDYVLVAQTRAREAGNAEVRAELARLFSAAVPPSTG